jgi:hypothetical protein
MNNKKGPHFGIFQSKGPYLDLKEVEGNKETPPLDN